MKYSLLFISVYCNACLALGLGDITLKSHLNEPLTAKVNITDVEKSPDASCFSVADTGDTPAFKSASITLQPTSVGYQLTINTHAAIAEPIVNLHVAYHCEPNLHRDYVLLLDPAPPANNITGDADQTSARGIAANNKQQMTVTGTSAEVQRTPAAPKKKVRIKSIAKPDIDAKLMEAYIGKKPSSIASQMPPAIENKHPTEKNRDASHSGEPYLTISGGGLKSDEKTSLPALALRLDTQIDFARAEPAAQLSRTDMMDEVTVLTNRLAHLEKQLISLQSANVQLQNEIAQANEHLAEQKTHWLQNFMLAIGLIAFIACAEWVRRKLTHGRRTNVQDHWFEPENSVAVSDGSVALPANNAEGNVATAKNNIFDDAFFDDSIYSHAASLENIIANSPSMTDENSDDHENILESADVFIEHGRPGLAIQLLKNHLIDFPSESPRIWLKLLNLLAEGSEAEYEQAVNECSQHYNIKMPSFAEAKKADHSSIEDFPHIVTRLEGIWGSPLAVGFLNDLIFNQQSQPIEGFGRETFEELFFLKHIAEQLSSSTSKDHDDFYQTVAMKPSLDNMAFNEATFAEGGQTGNTNQASKAPAAEPIADNSQTAATKRRISIEDSPFQTLPSYDVGMLFDSDDELITKIADSANENTVQSENDTPAETMADLAENSALAEIKPTLQAEEIDFSQHMQEIAQIQSAENESLQETTTEPDNKNQKAKASNLIEWDLPKI